MSCNLKDYPNTKYVPKRKTNKSVIEEVNKLKLSDATPYDTEVKEGFISKLKRYVWSMFNKNNNYYINKLYRSYQKQKEPKLNRTVTFGEDGPHITRCMDRSDFKRIIVPKDPPTCPDPLLVYRHINLLTSGRKSIGVQTIK